MCFAPQRRALFQQLNSKKVIRARGVLCMLSSKGESRRNAVHYSNAITPNSALRMGLCAFWLRNVLRATIACNFWSLISPFGSAPAAFLNWKTQWMENTFSCTWLFFSSLLLPPLLFFDSFHPGFLFVPLRRWERIQCFAGRNHLGRRWLYYISSKENVGWKAARKVTYVRQCGNDLEDDWGWLDSIASPWYSICDVSCYCHHMRTQACPFPRQHKGYHHKKANIVPRLYFLWANWMIA